MNAASVRLVFIGSLKTKTTAAEGETPLAGGGEVMVGSALADDSCMSAQVRTNDVMKLRCIQDTHSVIMIVISFNYLITVRTCHAKS